MSSSSTSLPSQWWLNCLDLVNPNGLHYVLRLAVPEERECAATQGTAVPRSFANDSETKLPSRARVSMLLGVSMLLPGIRLKIVRSLACGHRRVAGARWRLRTA